MRLSLRRRSAAAISVEPATVRPGDTLRITVAIDDALEEVESARVVLGYENTYWYLRMGGSHRTPGLFETQTSSSGSNPDRERTDWVDAGEQALALNGGTLEAGTRTIELPVPSWAPGSADQVAAWRARLEVRRKGRDVDAEAQLVVLAPVPAQLAPMASEALSGGDTATIAIELDRNIVRPGEHVTGTVTLTTTGDAPDADVAVYLRWCKVSHPLERTPALDREGMERPVTTLNKKQRLLPGMPVVLPFDVTLDPEARPTVQTVHADFGWSLVVRILYAGFNAHVPQSVARPFVVVNG